MIAHGQHQKPIASIGERLRSEMNIVECAYCETKFDDDSDGHTDIATGLSFCGPVCENHYDRETGLPKVYEKPYDYEG